MLLDVPRLRCVGRLLATVRPRAVWPWRRLMGAPASVAGSLAAALQGRAAEKLPAGLVELCDAEMSLMELSTLAILGSQVWRKHVVVIATMYS